MTEEEMIDGYIFNLVTLRCRNIQPKDKLYFSSRLNVSLQVRRSVLGIIDSVIQQEIHGETLPIRGWCENQETKE